jgi:endonuclease YncB( thermonuclease family)
MQLLSSTLLVATLCLLASSQKVTEVFSGNVIGVSDGDTIEVLINRKATKVRLEAIDSPESNQSYGNRAKQELSRLVFGKLATIRKTGEDRYGRVLGYVMIGDIEVNSKLVEEGWAWHYREYNDEERFAKLEVEAREAKRGLWEDPKPLAPWEFRARQKRDKGEPATQFWLNTSSNVRHNQNCEHFRKSSRGRICSPNEGKACGICGG